MDETKTIILQTLQMQNFKGATSTTEFCKDCTTIAGRNGLGKTRHFTAFHWCLFGKDEQGRENYEVKTRVNGGIQHRITTAVELTLLVDGKQTTLRRELVEKWVRPRGQETEVYKGDETKCFWNGVPVSVTEYKSRVNDLIDADLFKLLTNTKYFINLHWRKQREILMQIVDVPSDEELLASIDEDKRQALVDIISNKSLEDARKEVASAITKLKEQLAEIQPRIDQTAKMMPPVQDWKRLQEVIQHHDAQLAELDSQLADIENQYSSAVKEQREILRQITNKKFAIEQRTAILREEANRKLLQYNADQRRAADEANAERKQIQLDVDRERTYLTRHEGEAARCERFISTISREIDDYETSVKLLREEWSLRNKEQWNGETYCNHCGQQLPADMIEQAKEIFESEKAKNLQAIIDKGNEKKQRIADMQKELAEETARLEDANKRIEASKQRIAELEAKLATTTEKEPMPALKDQFAPKYDEDAELARLTNELDALQATTGQQAEKADNSLILAKKRDLMQKRDEAKAVLETKIYRETAEKEIARQKELGRQYAQMIADKERIQFAIQQFSKAKIASVQESINALFNNVSFEMFAYTNEGNEYEACIPYIDGQAFGSANTAAQYNATLEICDVLAKAHNICTPIFIDGVESVNDPYIPASQCIMLRVTEDAELKVIHETAY